MKPKASAISYNEKALEFDWSKEKQRLPSWSRCKNGLKMTKYMTAKDRLHETEALMAALGIVRRAGLALDCKIAVLPPEFARYLIAPDAFVLVAPATEANSDDWPNIVNAMRLSRCDALIVRIGQSIIGAKKVVLDIGINGLTSTWYHEYRPCTLDGVLHFVPDHDTGGPIFKLTQKGLTSSVEFNVWPADE